MHKDILKPKALRPGDTIGVFTPSAPAYIANEGLFLNGVATLNKLGFKIKLGALTARRGTQGYRSGSAKERADELMSLICDPEVHAVMSTIGGNNSASLIPYLDFERIRAERKILCGFSDVTSLHTAFLKFAGLRTIYGPSVMCWMGEWPDGIAESSRWFLEAAMTDSKGPRKITPPTLWSNHARRWDNGDWKNLPREWKTNDGWHVLNAGTAAAPILALNLNTLVSSAGTDCWPNFEGKILLIEDMLAPLSRTERHLTHLKLIGVFEKIAGLIVGKPEIYDQESAPFGYDDLIREIVGVRSYPIVSNFDCSHTSPMISILQLSPVRLSADTNGVSFEFLEEGARP